ncbi:MAG TPA: hypothetical protein VK762_15670 [Polyangiaceae bacterium]|nr:hypothetical protein [Polyangiaceae bacterium]
MSSVANIHDLAIMRALRRETAPPLGRHLVHAVCRLVAGELNLADRLLASPPRRRGEHGVDDAREEGVVDRLAQHEHVVQNRRYEEFPQKGGIGVARQLSPRHRALENR